ncbi:hypothetical protein LDENG_00160830 [Lucifuga dentata]|nr:hypothetical protein LDENG_00160830 [Lucifuga dentata]
MGCLVVASVVTADGQLFLLDLKNSSGFQGFRDAEQACATQHARLASAEELRHAVVECSFSPCTRGWLYGGTVGTTVCNFVGGALKAVDVRTENATEDTARLDAFCVKDKGVPCGDPPSFPNARLQGHTGFEMGDELLYTCVPGYVMPSGHSAFSLLCDSCGEWYGIVHLCVKGETESHVDYEDKFTDTYGEAENPNKEERSEETHGEMYEVVHGASDPEGRTTQEQQETSFFAEEGEEHQDQQGEEEEGENERVGEGEDEQGRNLEGIMEGREKEEEQAVEDFTGHPRLDQERTELVRSDAAMVTEAPVSLLSQKHLFWFPSEAFQEEGHPVSTNPVTQTTHRASSIQSEESKEHESQESYHQHDDIDDLDHEHDSDDFHDQDNHDDDGDDDDSHHVDKDIYDNSQRDDQDDPENYDDSHQDQDDHDDHVKHYIPAQHDDLDRHSHHDHHDDHYDMGEHEDERDRVRYGTQGDFDDQDESYVEHHDHESYEDHEDVTDDHRDDDREHPDGSEEHPDHDDHNDSEEHYDLNEDEDDNDHDHYDHDDRDHDDHDYDNHDDHDSHEDDDGHQHVIIPMATDVLQNFTQKEQGQQVTATTDETWLDGYPVVAEHMEKGREDRERGTVVRVTDRPNEVEDHRRISYTRQPEVPEAPTMEPDIEPEVVEEVWPGLISTAAPSPDSSEPSDSPSYPDTLDYDTQQAAPTQSWLGDLTELPFLNHGPAPPVHDDDDDDDDDDIIETGRKEEHTEHSLPGETGERGEVEGERGETICTGENCPPRPPGSSSRGPTVAAIIVAVCAVAMAVIVGVWCYRRQQQKSSMYEMNGKGQSQSRHGQQIEMQQKV